MLTQIAFPRRWPSQCLICRSWPAQRLCAACIRRFDARTARCQGCALPVPEGVVRCGRCLGEPPALDGCHAALAYAWPWTLCVARLKFQQDVSLAGTLAAIMRSKPALARASGRAHWVLPVPSTRQHLMARGYNPAQLLARALAGARCHPGLLQRVGTPAPQRGLDRAQRLTNPRGSFALAAGAAPRLAGRRVALVDDVMTTGATLNELARTLKAAGVAEVVALVLARDD